MTWLLAGCGLVIVAAFFGMLKLRAYSDARWAIYRAGIPPVVVTFSFDASHLIASLQAATDQIREFRQAFAPLHETRWQRVRRRFRRLVHR